MIYTQDPIELSNGAWFMFQMTFEPVEKPKHPWTSEVPNLLELSAIEEDAFASGAPLNFDTVVRNLLHTIARTPRTKVIRHILIQEVLLSNLQLGLIDQIPDATFISGWITMFEFSDLITIDPHAIAPWSVTTIDQHAVVRHLLHIPAAFKALHCTARLSS